MHFHSYFWDAYILLFIIFIDLVIFKYTFINITKHLECKSNKLFIYFNTGIINIVSFLPRKLPIVEDMLFPFILFWFYFNLLYHRYIHTIRKIIYFFIMKPIFHWNFIFHFYIKYGFSR